MLIVLANRSVASYPQGGGVWSWMLQYPLGLRALGHNIFWLELMKSSGDAARDGQLASDFLARIAPYGLAPHAAVLVFKDLDLQDLKHAEVYGRPALTVYDLVRSADLLWNFACAVRLPFLARFGRRALIDVDPGHLQVISTQYQIGLKEHQVFLTVGPNLPSPNCEAPKLGLTWHGFLPFVYLPMWQPSAAPAHDAPFTSITQWTWEEYSFEGRVMSASKRAAYMRYVDLPKRAGRAFELAAHIGETDPAGDRAKLEAGGWRLADPHRVTPTPEAYREYLSASRAEILCPKPMFREWRTGWFSDRSVCYMALGRPVLAEDTGFGDFIPTGRGVLSFRDIDEAAAGVAEIDGNYEHHSRVARELAGDLLNSDRQLRAMLEVC